MWPAETAHAGALVPLTALPQDAQDAQVSLPSQAFAKCQLSRVLTSCPCLLSGTRRPHRSPRAR